MHRLLQCFAVAILLAWSATLASAQTPAYERGDLRIIHPWSRALPSVSRNGAVYLTIENERAEDARLVTVTSPISERAEIHHSSMADGMMKMRHVEALEIPAAGRAELAPGGHHIMLIGLTESLDEGKTFPLTLQFDDGASVEVEVKVLSTNTQSKPRESHTDTHDG